MFRSFPSTRNRGGDPPLLRRANESALLELIQEKGPITRLDIAHQLNLSLPTITRIVNPLISSGQIIERSVGDSSGGRRPSLLEFNFRSRLIISAYTGLYMFASLSDLNGEVLARRSVHSRPGDEGLQQLIGLIESLRAEAAQMGLPVQGVCVGAQAIVTFPDGVVQLSPTLGWRNLPLKALLEEALQLPVVVENEVNLIALGEIWRGAARGLTNIICISLGDGIGAGLVLGGHLYRGSHWASGEIGYLVPSERYLGKIYDRYGCLEGLAGSSGITRRTIARLEAGETSVLSKEGGAVPADLTAEQVLNAARAGDPLAGSIVAETVDLLSIAIANLTSIVDPERIILSGDLANFSDLLIEPIRQRIQGLLPAAMPEIVQSDLRMDAAVLGAVAIVMRHTSDAVFIQTSSA
jgi:glucokinase